MKVKTVGTFEWVTADRKMVLQEERPRAHRAGRGRGDHVLRRHRGPRAAGQPHHHRGDARKTPSTKRRRVACARLLGRGELPDRAPERARQRRPRSRRPPCARPRGELTRRRHHRGGVGRQRRAHVPRHGRGADQDRARRSSSRPSEALKVDAAGKAGAQGQRCPPVPALLAPPHQTEITYPDPAQRHHAAGLEAGAGRRRLSRDAGLQRLLQPAPGGPHGHQGQLGGAARAGRGQVLLARGGGGQGRRGRAPSPTSRASR